MKRILCAILAVLMLAALSTPAMAEDASTLADVEQTAETREEEAKAQAKPKAPEDESTVADESAVADEYEYIIDEPGLLTEDQLVELNARAEAITDKYMCGVVVFVVGDMYDYDVSYKYDGYDAYYLNKAIHDELDYGYGSDKSCLILCLSMAARDYWLEPYGYAKTAFTDHGIDIMLDNFVLPQLKENNYYAAFSVYLDKADEFLKLARDGKPFDEGTDPDVVRTKLITKLVVTVLVSFLIALIVCSVWKAKMKTAKLAKTADNYIPEGGFNLTSQTDDFLYRTTTRTKIQTSSSGSGSRSRPSGSSGRGGKF